MQAFDSSSSEDSENEANQSIETESTEDNPSTADEPKPTAQCVEHKANEIEQLNAKLVDMALAELKKIRIPNDIVEELGAHVQYLPFTPEEKIDLADLDKFLIQTSQLEQSFNTSVQTLLADPRGLFNYSRYNLQTPQLIELTNVLNDVLDNLQPKEQEFSTIMKDPMVNFIVGPLFKNKSKLQAMLQDLTSVMKQAKENTKDGIEKFKEKKSKIIKLIKNTTSTLVQILNSTPVIDVATTFFKNINELTDKQTQLPLLFGYSFLI